MPVMSQNAYKQTDLRVWILARQILTSVPLESMSAAMICLWRTLNPAPRIFAEAHCHYRDWCGKGQLLLCQELHKPIEDWPNESFICENISSLNVGPTMVLLSTSIMMTFDLSLLCDQVPNMGRVGVDRSGQQPIASLDHHWYWPARDYPYG